MVRFEIGNEYESLAGGVLTVAGTLKDHVVVTCSVCSSDKELFPKPFKVTKNSIKIGKPCCGCNVRYSYNESQQKVRVKRLCEIRGLVFNGFKGEFKGVMTKLNLSCEKGHLWDSTIIHTFMKGECGCVECGNAKTGDTLRHKWVGKTRETCKGNTLTVVKEIPSDKGIMLKVKCTECNKDRELFPDGFIQCRSDWKKGKIPCGCSGNLRYSKEQYAIICRRSCETLGDRVFEGFHGEWRGCDTKVILRCPSHGTWNSSNIDKLIRKDYRSCPICTLEKTSFGRYRARDYELDTLYLLLLKKGGEVFIKIGRTFELQSRLKPIQKLYEVEVLGLYSTIHHHIHVLETAMHRLLKEYHYTPRLEFGGCVRECFHKEALDHPTVKSLFKL